MKRSNLFPKVRAVGLMSAVSLTCVAVTTAYAQDRPGDADQGQDGLTKTLLAAPDAGNDIVVTGFRASIAQALDAKRNANDFQDSILAEDIGKFPELNLAESLARIPGVQISRENGEGRQVSLRGLGPNFTRVTLNGLPISPEAGDGDGRAVDFDIFPSELFSKITVDKSSRADLLEGGLAGNIDLENAKPLNTKGFHVRYTAKAEYQQLSEKLDPRGTLVVSGNWHDRFGVLLGASYSRRRYRSDNYNTQGWTRPRIDVNGNGVLDPDERANTGFQFSQLDPSSTAGVSAEALANSRFPRLPRPDSYAGERERIGVVGSVQFRPVDTLTLSLDGFYNRLNEPKEGGSGDWALRNSKDLTPSDLKIDDNGTVVSGHFDNVDLYGLTSVQKYKTTFYQGVFSADWDPSDIVHVDGRAGYSKAHWNRFFSLFIFHTPPSEGLGIDYEIPDTKAAIPVVTPDFDVTDPSLYQLSDIRNQPYESSSQDLSGRFNVRVGGDDANVRVGLAYDREKRHRERRQANGPPTMFAPDFNQSEVASLTTTSLDHYLHLSDDPLGFSTWLQGDLRALDARFDFAKMQDNAPILETGTASTLEENLSGYFEVNGVTQILGKDLRANAGVRVTHTNQTVTSPFNGAEVRFDRSYVEPLPSMNLTYNLTHKLLLRFAAARTMTRPIPSDLEPTTTVDPSGNVTQHNPNLAPYFSNQFDVGAEWYFQPRAVLAADFFYKRITGFIESAHRQAPFRDAGIAISSLAPLIQSGLTDGLDTLVQFNTEENAPDPQTVKGLELAYQQPLDFVVPGLGFLGNVTYVDDSDAPRVTGLAKYSYNVVGYYERGPIQFRLSYNYRGKYVTCPGPCTDGLPEQSYNKAQGYLDLSASYKLPVRWDVALTLDAINITNETVTSYTGFDNRLLTYEKPGSIFLVGLRGSF